MGVKVENIVRGCGLVVFRLDIVRNTCFVSNSGSTMRKSDFTIPHAYEYRLQHTLFNACWITELHP